MKNSGVGRTTPGGRRNGKGTGEDFLGPRTGPHSSGLIVVVKRAQNDSRQWLQSFVREVGADSNQTVHHGVKFVDERSGPLANIIEITWPHRNASKLEVQLNLLPLEVHIIEEM